MRLTHAVCEGKFFVVVERAIALHYPIIYDFDRVGDAHPPKVRSHSNIKVSIATLWRHGITIPEEIGDLNDRSNSRWALPNCSTTR